MKKRIFSFIIWFAMGVDVVFAQNVGIGTDNPQAQLHVQATGPDARGHVLFAGLNEYGQSAPLPASGPGRRMLWYPDRSAFRAGTVSGMQWDLDSLGDHSAAFGQNTVAASWGSFTAGVRSRSMGYASTALGYESNATGYAASAMGYKNIASGFGAAAVGRENTASGFVAIALGWENTSSGHGSMALGYQSSATDFYNIAMGDNALAIGRSSLSLGKGTRSVSWNSAALGKFNVGIGSAFPASGDVVLEIGNGSSDQNRSNAMTVFANGRVLIGSGSAASARLHVMDSSVVFTGPAISVSLPDVLPPVSGEGRRMMWYAPRGAFRAGGVSSTQWDINAIGNYSFAAGFNTQASGVSSVAFGSSARATQPFAIAMGENSLASSSHSIAMGGDATASGSNAVAIGAFSSASGTGSVAMGSSTRANAMHSVALGTRNLGGGNAISWVATDPIFEIGNGQPGGTPSNAITVLKNGRVGIGLANPGAPLEVSNENAMVRITNPSGGTTGIEFLRPGGGDDWRLHNTGGLITLSRSTNDLGSVTDHYVFTQSTFRPAVDNTQTVGQGNFRWVSVHATNGTIQTSDARLKENIQPLNYGLQTIAQLRPVSYRWKDNPAGDAHLGFLAQEVQALIPEAVHDAGNGQPLGMQYSELIPVLVKAIQELKAEIEILKQNKK
jgi:hypothetical protein